MGHSPASATHKVNTQAGSGYPLLKAGATLYKLNKDYDITIVVNNVKAATNHFIVVVVYKNKFADPTVLPDFYIIPSAKVAGLSEDYNGQLRLLKGKIIDYQNKWEPLKS